MVNFRKYLEKGDKGERMNIYLRILLFGIGGFGLLILLFEIPNMKFIVFSVICILFIGMTLNMIYEDWRGYNHD